MNIKTEEKHTKLSGQLTLETDESEELFRLIFESNPDAILVSDREGFIRLINRKAEQVLNLSTDNIIGRKMHLFCHYNESKEVIIPRPGKDTGIAEIRSTEITLSGSQPLHVANLRDITELVRMREEMRALAFVDDLVGLCNRRGFLVLAEQQVKLANRSKKGLYLLLISIDNFKQVNTTQGQQAGNRLLLQFAKILKDTFRNTDIIARVGEDTFAVLTIEAEAGSSEIMAHRLLHKLEAYNVRASADSAKLLASMGTAYHQPKYPGSLEALLQQADLQICDYKRGKQKSALLWYLGQDKEN